MDVVPTKEVGDISQIGKKFERILCDPCPYLRHRVSDSILWGVG